MLLSANQICKYLYLVPYPAIKEGRIKMRRYPLFKVFPVLLGLVSTWLLCAILTAAAPESEIWTDPSSVWYHARTGKRTIN